MKPIQKQHPNRQPSHKWRELFTICWITLCLGLGGASNAGVLGNLLLQGGAAAICAIAIFKCDRCELLPGERTLSLLLFALAGWIALTLLPLPPALWTYFPGREFVAQGYRQLDMELPWLPISLADERTVRAALSLFVPVSCYVLTRRSSESQRRKLGITVVIFACLSVIFGMAQLLGGTDSPLRPYIITNRTQPVGLFANANHFATLLLIAIPLAFAAFSGSDTKRRASLAARAFRYLGFSAAALCLIGLVLVGSNAGLILMLPALIGGILLGPQSAMLKHRRSVSFGGIAAVALACLAIFAMSSGLLNDAVGVSASSRQQILATTMSSAVDYLPTGSGLGTFPAIYLMDSGGQGTSREWMNHAHNDPAEIVLELGLPGILLILLFGTWLIRRTLTIWNDARIYGAQPLRQAASLGATLIALHSFADYPLRSAAIAAVLGVLLALMTGKSDKPSLGSLR